MSSDPYWSKANAIVPARSSGARHIAAVEAGLATPLGHHLDGLDPALFIDVRRDHARARVRQHDHCRAANARPAAADQRRLAFNLHVVLLIGGPKRHGQGPAPHAHVGLRYRRAKRTQRHRDTGACACLRVPVPVGLAASPVPQGRLRRNVRARGRASQPLRQGHGSWSRRRAAKDGCDAAQAPSPA